MKCTINLINKNNSNNIISGQEIQSGMGEANSSYISYSASKEIIKDTTIEDKGYSS